MYFIRIIWTNIMMTMKTRELIEKILKEEKLNYLFDNGLFEIFVGSYECYIEMEDEDSIIFFDTSEYGFSFYEEYGDLSGEEDRENFLECYISDLVDFTKKKARILNKIKCKIEDIDELAEELGANVDSFISFNYIFD